MSSTTELQEWLNGTPTGGPNGDGRYPLTAKDGTVFLVYCPAAQALNPALAEQPVEVFSEQAQTAANDAAADAAAADQHRIDAATSAANAAASASAAATSANTANTHKNSAATSATNAASSESAAATSATNAESARAAAQDWASKNEDSVVSGGLYSALHYAAKAAESAASVNMGNYLPKADPTFTGTLTGPDIAATGGVSVAGNAVWHAGNFVPASKLDTSSFTWANLGGKPSTFAPSAHTHIIGDVTGLQTALDAKLATSSFTWANLSDKPATFAPSAHNHSATEISSGTLADARLSSNVALKNAANTFAANQTISLSGEARLDLNCTDGRSVRFVSNSTPNVGLYDYGAAKWLLRVGSDDLTTLGGGLTVNGSPTFNASNSYLNASSGIVDLYFQVGGSTQAGIFADNTPRLVLHTLAGGTIRFRPNGRGSTLNEARVEADGSFTDGSGRTLGYREATMVLLSGNLTLSDEHNTKTLYNNGGAARTVTLPVGVRPGTMIQILTYGGGSTVTLSRSSTNLYWIDGSGTNKNGNRTIGIYGWATLWCMDGTNWFITGVGIT